MVTGDNETPNPVPEVLTGHNPPRTGINQSVHHIDSLDATLPTPRDEDPPMAAQDQIDRLSDVLTSLQNGPQLNSNSLLAR